MQQKLKLLAGIDEAGRGPLAGPVVAAAVILPDQVLIDGLTDSKRLSEKKRELLYRIITEQAIAWAVSQCDAAEIDEINILQASLLAMRKAVMQLTVKPDYAQVDGNKAPSLDCPVEAIIKGDLKVKAISAASIIAKVTRDRAMLEWDQQYPQYGFAKHKGYPTKDHMQALRTFGVTPIHRRSYKPVQQCMTEAL